MPQKIIIVRHGETQYNVERRLQGWTDIPLNANCLAQAVKVADRLRNEQIMAIYSSDHQRAHQTATHIARAHQLQLHKRVALREDRMGIFEGWCWEKDPNPVLEKLWAERGHFHKAGDLHWKVEGGESLAEHTHRVKHFLDQLEIKYPTGTIVVVSHGGTINRMMEIYGFKQITDDYISFKNTSVTILVKQRDKYQLTLMNDISHLSAL
jgi:probable phosphoglycerate mutase